MEALEPAFGDRAAAVIAQFLPQARRAGMAKVGFAEVQHDAESDVEDAVCHWRLPSTTALLDSRMRQVRRYRTCDARLPSW